MKVLIHNVSSFFENMKHAVVSSFDLREILVFWKWKEADKAALYGILGKIWGLLNTPLQIILITNFFSPVVQGFHYTCINLMSLQVFAEMGLGAVIVQFASHEWSKLRLNKEGKIIGDQTSKSRLVSLARFSFKWYLIANVIFFLIATITGFLLFSSTPTGEQILWKLPYVFICLAASLNLAFTPAWGILEGCNQVAQIYKYRLVYNIVTGICYWIAIIMGANLWAYFVMLFIGLLWNLMFILGFYRRFFIILIRAKICSKIEWWKEVFPLQWRVALTSLFGYFVFFIFTPVIFHYQGPILAGKVGMLLSLIATMTSLALIWTRTNTPKFGMLIAQKDFKKLDRQFYITTAITWFMLISGSLILFIIIVCLYASGLKIGSRFLSPGVALFFILANLINCLANPFGAYLRAHKKEPLFFLSISFGIATALCTWLTAKYFTILELAFVYFVLNVLFSSPVYYLWFRLKNLWHKQVNTVLPKTT